MSAENNSGTWPWAQVAYGRFLRVASLNRREITHLLDSGVNLRRIEALYPFASADFEQAIFETMLDSEALAESLCETFGDLNSLVYAELLLSQFAPGAPVDRVGLDTSRLAKTLPKAEPRYTELLSGATMLSQIPSVFFLLPKVDPIALSAAAVRNDYAGLMILMGDLPRLELALNMLLSALEAHEAATPPPLW